MNYLCALFLGIIAVCCLCCTAMLSRISIRVDDIWAVRVDTKHIRADVHELRDHVTGIKEQTH